MKKVSSGLEKPTYLITGACGTVGQELVRQLSRDPNIGLIKCLDNNESELFFLEEKHRQRNIKTFLCDIRDKNELIAITSNVDVIIHAAAFKHVILCERAPFEAVKTNILGVQNLLEASVANKVSNVIFTSSDKAVSPTNVMGASKLMGERLMTAADTFADETRCFSMRLGNVLGSRGSVVPIFLRQIRLGKPITITHNEMTRFVTTLSNAVSNLLSIIPIARGGEVFISKMPALRIIDLARVMIEEFAPLFGRCPSEIEISYIGLKPGEKMHEELLNHEEVRRVRELVNHFIILPALRKSNGVVYPGELERHDELPCDSGSSPLMNQNEVRKFLLDANIITYDNQSSYDRFWPELKP